MNRPNSINTIDFEYVRRSVRLDINSDFVAFLKQFIRLDVVQTIISEYYLGVTNSGDVIFFEIDIQRRCRTGKIMKYDSITGHRVKDPEQPNRITWVHSQLKHSRNLPCDWMLSQCLFGEHLLAKYPDKLVGLVESEKTAIICAAFLPQYVWLATGGKSQLNERVLVLRGRRVIAFPDLDAIELWKEKVKQFPDINITISLILERKASTEAVENNIDIADWIIAWVKNNSNQEEI